MSDVKEARQSFGKLERLDSLSSELKMDVSVACEPLLSSACDVGLTGAKADTSCWLESDANIRRSEDLCLKSGASLWKDDDVLVNGGEYSPLERVLLLSEVDGTWIDRCLLFGPAPKVLPALEARGGPSLKAVIISIR